MAINSWLEKAQFHELHPLSVKLFVLNDAYQWERYVVCNDIMAPACGLNLCEVETWENFRFVCPLGTSLILLLTTLASFSSKSQINRLHWFVFPTAASA